MCVVGLSYHAFWHFTNHVTIAGRLLLQFLKNCFPKTKSIFESDYNDYNIVWSSCNTFILSASNLNATP